MAPTKTDEFVLAAMRKFAAAGTLGDQQEAVVTVADVIDELVTAAKLTMAWFDEWGYIVDVLYAEEYTALKDAVAKVDGK